MNEDKPDVVTENKPAHQENALQDSTSLESDSVSGIDVGSPEGDGDGADSLDLSGRSASDQPGESVAENDRNEPPIQRQTMGFIYALGQLEVVFPNKGVKKEFLQAAMTLAVKEDDYYGVFTNQGSTTEPNKYRYLAEQVEWVLTIEEVSCYVIRPRASSVLDILISAIKPPADTISPIYNCVIGTGITGSNSLGLTEVICEQLYFHTMEELHASIKQVASAETDAIQDVIKELEYKPNKGDTDSDRAKNFIAFRYPDVYRHTHQMKKGSAEINKSSLVEIIFKPFDGVSERKIVDVVFVYKEDSSGIRIFYFCRVDVTGLYPFINTQIQRYTPIQPYQPSQV